MDETNLVRTFFAVAKERSGRPFLWAKTDGKYQAWSWDRVADEVQRVANALSKLGLERGDRVLLVAENRPEWCIADLAVMQAGGITVPAYTTNTVQDHAYILEHSGASIVVCSGGVLAKRLLPAVKSVESVRSVLFIDTAPEHTPSSMQVLDWQEALQLGEQLDDVAFSDKLQPDDIACFIYTSGTGGRPKGVMLSHKNILANVAGARELLRMVDVDEDDVFLSFLPLSHSYEHTAGQFFPMAMGAQIYYAEGIETLSANLLEARPTILPCVPRLYEVLRQKILSGVKRQGGLKAQLFDQAISLGKRRYQEGRLPAHLSAIDALLDRLVRKKVNERFGGRLKAMVSGGAPLNYDVGLFFVALGLPVLQGYGQTEAAPVISANLPGRSKIDTVGPPLKGVEVQIADDGEILVKGDNVMRGYWQDQEATESTVRNGWLHTGDIGTLDHDGYLKITDRKKDIIVNSGGDNISPQRVEGMLMLEPEIAQALVVGDRRPYLVALIAPDADFQGSMAQSGNGDFENAIAEAVKRTNKSLSQIERIRRYEILREPFSVENGMMTPTMKLRRPIIIERFSETIAKLYAGAKNA